MYNIHIATLVLKGSICKKLEMRKMRLKFPLLRKATYCYSNFTIFMLSLLKQISTLAEKFQSSIYSGTTYNLNLVLQIEPFGSQFVQIEPFGTESP